jgi:hypothetical protein
MIFVPALHTHSPTHHSRELSRRIEQVVRDYQRDNPDASPSDVRIALAQLASGDSPEAVRRKQALAMVIGFLGVGAFTFMASTGGGSRFDNNTMMWGIIGGFAALLGVTIAVIRTIRRS